MSLNNNRGSTSSNPLDNELISPLQKNKSSIKETEMIQLKQMSVVKEEETAEVKGMSHHFFDKKHTDLKSNYSLISVQSWKRKQLNAKNIQPPNVLGRVDSNALRRLKQTFKMYDDMSYEEIKSLLQRQTNIVIVLDFLCLVINIVVVTWLYVDHFDFLHNNNDFNDSNLLVRYICLGLSFLSCMLLIIRKNSTINLTNTKYYLNIIKYPYTKRLFSKSLIIELLIHIIQPYPYVRYTWVIVVLGVRVPYTIDMILFTFCILRLYVIYKVFLYWFIFSSDRSKRILHFFQGEESYDETNLSFLYKAARYYYSFYFLIVVFGLFIYFLALIFKTYEDYDPNGLNQGFNYIWNCLWFLIVTMTTIGYGDYTPQTMIGRMIAVVCCVIGIFLLSLIAVTFFISMIMVDENEISAYEQILFASTDDMKSSNYHSYVNNYIKYKINKLRTSTNENSLFSDFTGKYKLLVNRRNFLIKLRRKANLDHMSLPDFTKSVNEIWGSDKIDLLICELDDKITDIITGTEKIIKKRSKVHRIIRDSKTSAFQLFNLSAFYSSCGKMFDLQNIKAIQGSNLISYDDLYASIDMFKNQYRNRKMTEGYDNTNNPYSSLNISGLPNEKNKSKSDKTLLNTKQDPNISLNINKPAYNTQKDLITIKEEENMDNSMI